MSYCRIHVVYYSHVLHLLSLGAQLREVCRLLAMMVHMHAQARRVTHSLLADVTLQGALASVVLVPDVNLQVVPVSEESMAGRAFDAARFTVPS